MKALVEETYLQNGNTSTTLIAHSMGAPMTLLFLQRQSQSWKNKYISKILTLAGAWGGTAKAIKVFAVGDDLGSFALSGKVLREEQITSPSLAWLMPSKYFWKPGEVFVRTNSSVYTFSDLKRFFQDLDYMTGWEMYQDNLKYKEDFSAPGVEIHCLFGFGVKTVER
jgi:lysophospholipase III